MSQICTLLADAAAGRYNREPVGPQLPPVLHCKQKHQMSQQERKVQLRAKMVKKFSAQVGAFTVLFLAVHSVPLGLWQNTHALRLSVPGGRLIPSLGSFISAISCGHHWVTVLLCRRPCTRIAA